jgi:hypothetical protein
LAICTPPPLSSAQQQLQRATPAFCNSTPCSYCSCGAPPFPHAHSRDSAGAATAAFAAASACPRLLHAPALKGVLLLLLLLLQPPPEPCHEFPSLVTPFCSIALLFIRSRALTGCPDNRIKDCVEALSPPQQSLLIQYIYRVTAHGATQRGDELFAVECLQLSHRSLFVTVCFQCASQVARCCRCSRWRRLHRAVCCAGASPSTAVLTLLRSAMSARPTVLDLPSMQNSMRAHAAAIASH